MGIHFLCPNGHPLNVKKELAGKVGYCPKCRAKLIIPGVDVQEPPVSPKPAPRSEPKERLDDDPTVLWHLHTVEGQDYGPADGAVIKSWIKERRIGPKTLVWRQGWQDWQEAGKVFPEIRAIFEAPENEEQGNEGGDELLRASVARLVDSRAASRSELERRKKKAMNSYRLILGLIGVIALLSATLITILFIR